MTSSSAHPREGGDPGFFVADSSLAAGVTHILVDGITIRTKLKKAWIPAFAGMSGI
jgi:hypothetical protein